MFNIHWIYLLTSIRSFPRPQICEKLGYIAVNNFDAFPQLLYGVNDGAKKQRQGARGLPKGAILHQEGVTQTWPGRLGQGRGLCPAAQLANLHFLSQPLTQRGAPSHS